MFQSKQRAEKGSREDGKSIANRTQPELGSIRRQNRPLFEVPGSLEVAWVVAHGIFLALLWVLFFACARRLQLPTATAFLLATATSLIPFGPRNFFLLGQNALIQPLELIRIPAPGLSFLLLLVAAMSCRPV